MTPRLVDAPSGYALLIECKEVRAPSTGREGSVITYDGQLCAVTFSTYEGSWYTATPYSPGTELPHDLAVWPSVEEAKAFTRDWKAHPWYVQPKAFRVVRVLAKYQHKIRAYEPMNDMGTVEA